MSQIEAPKAANRRLLAALVFLAVAVFAEGIAIVSMLPLKQRIPYFVTSNPASGAVSASLDVAQRFTPTQANEKYFLAKWTIDLLTINSRTAKFGLPASYTMLRGGATGEWSAFVLNQWKPIDRLKKDPATRVYPTVDAIGMLSDTSAVIRVTTRNASGVIEKHLLVTVKFAIIPPTSTAQVYTNPIGLWITHFQVTNEALQQ
ncbi:MAG TPA: VirB8/TrbF family protein [Nevskiaceae bacterium]|nr:VirB8/TrbF family protein [Nevskiaceae bacterium]